ncbi:hypothetical protein DH2020_042372 [Rehmannia glutinosa]|uniref:Endonuclease/exonuclease/phosphatase domain-containing protein n=1 Tax=Rehmannia glutinosa TaxID=99300 RepID=A0ABR0UPC1_REHGL
METKLEATNMEKLNRNKLGFTGCFPVNSVGKSGGLCLLWNSNVQVDLISFSSHHITSNIELDQNQQPWVFSGIYGWPDNSQKWKTCQLMRDINPGIGKPWLCAGDFNEIMWSVEKIRGRFRFDNNMEEFRNTINNCGLTDLGFSGPRFTWTNMQHGDNNIQERLDRALANDVWISQFPYYRVTHLLRVKSDHNPLTIEFDHHPLGPTKPMVDE